MPLRGPCEWNPPDTTREPINIHPNVRKALRDLLHEEDMRGVGYSEFIRRAIDLAQDKAINEYERLRRVDP